MESLKPTLEELNFCMRDPKCIRNVCILAHVDHGKTTVADSLLATNRLISKRMAGFLRYLDDRLDEQQRGITMKSSAVSLLNLVHDDDDDRNKRILLNLIDTPGHIDFSSEVEAALRVCDGAIILVDLVEGVCVQTRECIKKAIEEHTKMILVLNKFDRLVVELRKDIDDIFQCILRVIEGCNAIVAELFHYEFLDSDINIEDTGMLFNPDSGNIIFASATDGWGITTKDVSRLFAHMVNNETVDSLNKKMWNFDCYVDSKKDIKTGAIDKKKVNLFIQFFLKTIVYVYETIVIRMEKEKTMSIINKLSIKNVSRDMTHSDPKVQVRAILQAWKPLATTILLQCLKDIPPPCNLHQSKIQYLLNLNRYCEDQYLNKCLEDIRYHFENLSVEDSTPLVAYISKMFCVDKKNLSQNKSKIFMPKPRKPNENKPEREIPVVLETRSNDLDRENRDNENADISLGELISCNDDVKVIALARIFTGMLRVGQEVYVLTGSYLPDKLRIEDDPDNFIINNKYAQKVIIKELYMIFGRELMQVDAIPAGNFCGIGGLEAHVLRTATLSSTLSMVPITEHIHSSPVVRHALEPAFPKDLPVLRNALKLLMQSDSCVEVVMQETGELVLLTAGDVHLGKCIEDLKNKFAKIEIHVSSPMVSLRETIKSQNPRYDFIKDISNYEVLEMAHFRLSVTVVPLPESIIEVIKNNYELLATVEQHLHKSFIDIVKISHDKFLPCNEVLEKSFKSEVTKKALLHVKQQLKTAFVSADQPWVGLDKNIWSVGNMNDCINILINYTPDYKHTIFLELNCHDKRALFDHFIVKAFNVLCKAGPLCEEPLTNCAFIVNKFELIKEVSPDDLTPQVTSLIESAVRCTFKRAFEKQEPGLMEPMYMTEIQVNTSILGTLNYVGPITNKVATY